MCLKEKQNQYRREIHNDTLNITAGAYEIIQIHNICCCFYVKFSCRVQS